MCAGLAEYCQWEQLEITCQSDEVIMISSAFYGRMQYGRCIRRDYGYVGCYADVRALADTRCSGRRSCRISVPDKLFDGTTPCPEDLKLYLMAGHTCVKGAVTFDHLAFLVDSKQYKGSLIENNTIAVYSKVY